MLKIEISIRIPKSYLSVDIDLPSDLLNTRMLVDIPTKYDIQHVK